MVVIFFPLKKITKPYLMAELSVYDFSNEPVVSSLLAALDVLSRLSL
jgi:hypothetical protein